MNEIRRTFRAAPGYDCHQGCAFGSDRCRPGSGGFHGIGSLRLYFAVAADGIGAVSFDLVTPMFPRSVLLRSGAMRAMERSLDPMGVLVLHFATRPDYYESAVGPDPCDLLDPGECWSDCTYVQGERGYDAFLSGGEKAVWSWLAEEWMPSLVRSGSC